MRTKSIVCLLLLCLALVGPATSHAEPGGGAPSKGPKLTVLGLCVAVYVAAWAAFPFSPSDPFMIHGLAPTAAQIKAQEIGNTGTLVELLDREGQGGWPLFDYAPNLRRQLSEAQMHQFFLLAINHSNQVEYDMFLNFNIPKNNPAVAYGKPIPLDVFTDWYRRMKSSPALDRQIGRALYATWWYEKRSRYPKHILDQLRPSEFVDIVAAEARAHATTVGEFMALNETAAGEAVFPYTFWWDGGGVFKLMTDNGVPPGKSLEKFRQDFESGGFRDPENRRLIARAIKRQFTADNEVESRLLGPAIDALLKR